MKISLFNKYIVASCFAISICTIQSCSDDESYDVVGDKTNKVFINTDHLNPIGTPKNSYTFEVQHTAEGSTTAGTINAKFPVKVTNPVESNTVITATIDNSAIEAYNNANSTSYSAVPESLIILDDMSASIAQGSTISGDSISVSIDVTKIGQLTDKSYLLPIKLSSVSDKSIEISSNYNAAYIIINTKEVLVKPNVPSANMQGSLVSDYSTWTATADLTSNAGAYTDMFDGSTTTRWGFASAPATVTIDMKTLKKVTGLRLFGYRAASNYTFSNVIVSTSSNSVDYQVLGTGTTSTMVNESGYQYIGFYKSVEAQYIQLLLTWRSSSQKGISEIGVYTAE